MKISQKESNLILMYFRPDTNYKEVNAEKATTSPDSIYHHYRKLMALRKDHLGLIYGDSKDLNPDHQQIFTYTRIFGNEQFLVISNVSSTEVDYQLPEHITVIEKLFSNLSDQTSEYSSLLRPLESAVFSVELV